jgi:ribosome-associated protein
MKAEDIVVVDVKKICSFTDVFVFVTGTSRVHLKALAAEILKRLREREMRPLAIDGLNETGWVVLDYGDVVAHLFVNEARRHYNLERLWGDGKPVDWKPKKADHSERKL